MMAGSVKDKAVSGLTWSALDNIASQGLTFIIGIILARILTPTEFGTLGIAMIFVGLFNQIVDCGFSNALIRNTEAQKIDYDTAFYFNIIVSVILFLSCYLLSPYISKFFDDRELNHVLKWMSFVIIINSVGIIQRTILIKCINFKTQTKISLIASVTSGIIGIISAILGCGVMSLVYQQLTRQSLNSILLWVLNKWRPQVQFSWISFKNQFSYGIKLLFSGLIDFVFTESASLVIGKFHSAATLGQYSRARQFSSIFSSNLSTIMQRVTFPVMALYQKDQNELVQRYRLIIKCLMLISGLLMMMLASTAKPVVYLTVGEKWAEAVIFLQIVCFTDMMYPIRQVNINVIQVVGRSDLVLKVTIIKRIIQAVPIVLGAYNIFYMLYGLVLASFISTYLNIYYASKCISYSIKSQIYDLFRPLLVSLIVGGLMFSVTIFDLNLYIQFPIQLILGFSIFFILMKYMKLPEYLYLRDIIYSMLLKFKH